MPIGWCCRPSTQSPATSLVPKRSRACAIVLLCRRAGAAGVALGGQFGGSHAALDAGLSQRCVLAAQRLSGVLGPRSEEHTSELQSHVNLVCRLLLEKKKHI